MQPIPRNNLRIPDEVHPKFSRYLAGPWLTPALAAIILITYFFDLNTPLGVPVWLLYFIPLILSSGSKPYFAIPTVCVVTLLFLSVGYIFSPPGVQTSAALLMRVIFALVFIGISAYLWTMRRKQKRA